MKNSSSKIVPANNFIISTRMGLGRGFVNLVDMATNQDLKGLIVDSSIIEASFLMYWYKGQSSIIQALGSGSTVQGITLNEINSLVISCPSLSEQNEVISFLTTLDSRITLQSEKVGGLQELKKGLMQKTFSQEIRFRREDGGEYPEWNFFSLGEVCQVFSGGTPPTGQLDLWNGDILWFTPSEIGKSKYLTESTRKISLKGLANSSAKLLPKGTILLTSRATLGEMGILLKEAATN